MAKNTSHTIRSKKNTWLYTTIGGFILLVLGITLFLTRPSLKQKLVDYNWYIFDETSVSLKMNDNTLTAKDRLFNSNGESANSSLAHIVFHTNGTGKINTQKQTFSFQWSLNKNVLTLKQRHGHKLSRAHWTLASTSGKVAGQKFKGYTVDSDSVANELFVGKGFLIHKK
ncbi:hypothetical protein WJM93_15975 [Lactiplantibacillus plantarum]|uniref:hypothetical protein n=1 Tax=Lactiplantibacillus plantarum TaxID=1590 RepID=UPI0030AE8652